MVVETIGNSVPLRGLADAGDHGAPQVGTQRLAQAHGGGALALAQGRRADTRHHHCAPWHRAWAGQGGCSAARPGAARQHGAQWGREWKQFPCMQRSPYMPLGFPCILSSMESLTCDQLARSDRRRSDHASSLDLGLAAQARRMQWSGPQGAQPGTPLLSCCHAGRSLWGIVPGLWQSCQCAPDCRPGRCRCRMAPGSGTSGAPSCCARCWGSQQIERTASQMGEAVLHKRPTELRRV